MEPHERQKSGKTLTDLQKARFDRLAERIRQLPEDRRSILMSAMEKQVFSLKEVAELLDCHTETIRRAIKAGKLKAAKVGRDYRISKPDLDEYWKDKGGGRLFSDDPEEE